jgi:hypothetical protein
MQSRAQHTREHQLQPLYCTVRHVLHVSAWHMSSMMAWNALCVQPVLHMDTMHWPAVPVVHSSGEAAHASCIKCILNRSLAARIGSIINIGTDTSCLLLPPPPQPLLPQHLPRPEQHQAQDSRPSGRCCVRCCICCQPLCTQRQGQPHQQG